EEGEAGGPAERSSRQDAGAHLSHLASDEAVRTSALSRRWCGVYAAVPVVDLVDPKKGTRERCSSENRPVCFDQMVTGAILCKPPGTPIRTFRLDAMSPPDDLLDQWIVTAVYSGVEEIDVKLRYWHDPGRRLCPFGSSEKASADFEVHQRNRNVKTQHHLFSCSTLRRLRLTNWTLDLPQGVVASSLETLCLARIMDPKGLLQQLLSSCPRLADLMLQPAGAPERQQDHGGECPPAELCHDLLPPCQPRQAAQLMPAVAALQRRHSP
uniref:F-box/LRR-repeat protein 15/At3g58940/PEG3-like LRR domain-containing protein n=2 Tax=Aegilops tauschii TaxID=37682 RepID=A0A453D434_AEGTS